MACGFIIINIDMNVERRECLMNKISRFLISITAISIPASAMAHESWTLSSLMHALEHYDAFLAAVLLGGSLIFGLTHFYRRRQLARQSC